MLNFTVDVLSSCGKTITVGADVNNGYISLNPAHNSTDTGSTDTGSTDTGSLSLDCQLTIVVKSSDMFHLGFSVSILNLHTAYRPCWLVVHNFSDALLLYR